MAETQPIQVPIEIVDRISGSLAAIKGQLDQVGASQAKTMSGMVTSAAGVQRALLGIYAAYQTVVSAWGMMRNGIASFIESERAANALNDALVRNQDIVDQATLNKYLEQLAFTLGMDDDYMKRLTASMSQLTGQAPSMIANMLPGMIAYSHATGQAVEEVQNLTERVIRSGVDLGHRFAGAIQEGMTTGERSEAMASFFDSYRSGVDQIAASLEGNLGRMETTWKNAQKEMGKSFADNFALSTATIEQFKTTFASIGTIAGWVTKVVAAAIETIGMVVQVATHLVESALVKTKDIFTNTLLGMETLWNWVASTWAGKKIGLGMIDTGALQSQISNLQSPPGALGENISEALVEFAKKMDGILNGGAAPTAPKPLAAKGGQTPADEAALIESHMKDAAKSASEIKASMSALNKELLGEGKGVTKDREKGAAFYEKRAEEERQKGNYESAGEYQERANKMRYGSRYDRLKELGALPDAARRGMDLQNYYDFGVLPAQPTPPLSAEGKARAARDVDTMMKEWNKSGAESGAASKIETGKDAVVAAVDNLGTRIESAFTQIANRLDQLNPGQAAT